MKIAFCTCVQIGLSCIESVVDQGGDFDLLITLNDNKAINKSGRIYLDDIAKTTSTPLLKIDHINDKEVLDAIKKNDIDWLFIIGWSQIASKEIVESPNLGVIGAHPTLLPVGRGRAAIPWAILKKEEKTGVSFFKMDEGVDTGDILGQYVIPLNTQINATVLYKAVNDAHIKLINQLWDDLIQNKLILKPQDHAKATYWKGRKPVDGIISSHMTMDEVDCLVRATTKPYPGAYVNINGQKVIVWSGVCSKKRLFENNNFEISLVDGYFYSNNYEIIID